MDVIITKYVPYRRGLLQGYFDILLKPFGIEIRNCSWYAKGRDEWVQMPAKPYKLREETRWYHLVRFIDAKKNKKFQDLVLKALDDFFQEDGTDF